MKERRKERERYSVEALEPAALGLFNSGAPPEAKGPLNFRPASGTRHGAPSTKCRSLPPGARPLLPRATILLIAPPTVHSLIVAPGIPGAIHSPPEPRSQSQ